MRYDIVNGADRVNPPSIYEHNKASTSLFFTFCIVFLSDGILISRNSRRLGFNTISRIFLIRKTSLFFLGWTSCRVKGGISEYRVSSS